MVLSISFCVVGVVVDSFELLHSSIMSSGSSRRCVGMVVSVMSSSVVHVESDDALASLVCRDVVLVIS